MPKIRNRFLVFQLELDPDQIAGILNTKQYKEESGIGVELSSLSNDRLSITVIEKKKVVDEINLPSGDKEIVERYFYQYMDMKLISISKGFYLVHLLNPPSSVRSAVNFLLEQLEDSSIHKYKFKLPNFHDRLKEENRVERLHVTSLKASSIPFSEKATAKLELFSESDCFRELEKKYNKYKLDKLIFNVGIDGGQYELSASSTGSISHDHEIDEEVFINSFINSIDY